MASGWGARHAVYRYESVTTMVERNNIVAQQAFAAQPSQSDAVMGSATVRLIALEEWDALAGEGIWSHAQTPAGQRLVSNVVSGNIPTDFYGMELREKK